MHRFCCLMVVLFLFVNSACYHATIDFEKKPSPVTIETPWATGWIFGLVPPETVKTARECPDGVAKVETKLGFWNQVVGILTLGIYTPMNVKVTCAASSNALVPAPEPDIVVSEGASGEEVIQAFQEAATQAVQQGEAVFVQY